MEPINFLTTLSVQELRSITQWHRFSIFFIGIVSVGMLIIQLQQLQTLYDLHHKQKSMKSVDATTIKNYMNLKEQELRATTKINLLNERISYQNDPSPYLRVLQEFQAGNIRLVSCTLTQHTITLTLLVPDSRSITLFAQKIGKTGLFKGLKLVSLNPHKSQLLGTLKGSLQGPK